MLGLSCKDIENLLSLVGTTSSVIRVVYMMCLFHGGGLRGGPVPSSPSPFAGDTFAVCRGSTLREKFGYTPWGGAGVTYLPSRLQFRTRPSIQPYFEWITSRR